MAVISLMVKKAYHVLSAVYPFLFIEVEFKTIRKLYSKYKKGHRCNIQTQEFAEIDCAQNSMTVEDTDEPESRAPPLTLHKLHKYHFL